MHCRFDKPLNRKESSIPRMNYEFSEVTLNQIKILNQTSLYLAIQLDAEAHQMTSV